MGQRGSDGRAGGERLPRSPSHPQGGLPMSHTPLSAQQLYDASPLGALIRFSDGAVEPPARHRRKHASWRSSNGTGRLVRKAPQKHALPASFTLHVGDFGSDDVTVVKAYHVFPVTSPLSFAIVDPPRP